MAASSSVYSGSFEFVDDDDPARPMHIQRAPRAAPAALPAAGPSSFSPPDSPVFQATPLLYVHSSVLQQLSAHSPVNADRPTLVHALMEACGLLEDAEVLDPPPATIEQLREFHSQEYLTTLARISQLSEVQLERLGERNLKALAAYGLEDDCAPFPGVYQLAAYAVGGSLAAAEALTSRRTRLAIHLDGGRHHAHKTAAAGFCFLNDVVLAILKLLGSFSRVMYVDVDVHHCDAVEEAFQLTERVLTISLHKRARGFFPGGGSHEQLGAGAGAGFSLNLPLADGLRDGLFLEAFSRLAGGAATAFRPDCVVLQCGVDGLAHDPVAASWGLTPAAYAGVAGVAASWGAPLLVLGGGGYSSPDAARAWTAAVAALHSRTLPTDVPEHDHLERYGPSFTFEVRELLGPDTNDRGEVLRMCDTLLAALRSGLCRGGGRGRGGAACNGAKRQKRMNVKEAVT